jgi:hypothetical protein
MRHKEAKMAHFAKVVNGTVVNVIKASQEFIDNYIDNSPGKWIKCSYNTFGGVHYDPNTGKPSSDQSKAIRKNFPSRGYSYDRARDAFIPPLNYPSWTLDENTCNWVAPIDMPNDGKYYAWNEQNQSWEEVNGN